jgi:pyridine nucleotide-disulfide oxidoreductase family protein
MTSKHTTLVLIGAGHAHALVLDAWRKEHRLGMKPVELILVSPFTQAPYSGMIPGWLAGQYTFEDSVIDFEPLCERAGAKLIQAQLVKLDPDTQMIWLSDGQCLSYDWLSLNVGSTLKPPVSDSNILSMRPLSTLKTRYESWLTLWQNSADASTLRLTAVGGGAAGVESLLCVQHRLKQLRPNKPIHAQLITRSAELLPGFSHTARYLASGALQHAGVTVRIDTDWCEAEAQNSDLVIWATGAQPQDWQVDPDRRGTLQTDEAGFIAVDACLRSLSHSHIFAVGDCAALPTQVPKAGVYAVRMGGTLATNLRHALLGEPLTQFKGFKGQGTALALLNIADGSAIASWRVLGWRGQWVMRWKDRIDRDFINRFA